MITSRGVQSRKGLKPYMMINSLHWQDLLTSSCEAALENSQKHLGQDCSDLGLSVSKWQKDPFESGLPYLAIGKIFILVLKTRAFNKSLITFLFSSLCFCFLKMSFLQFFDLITNLQSDLFTLVQSSEPSRSQWNREPGCSTRTWVLNASTEVLIIFQSSWLSGEQEGLKFLSSLFCPFPESYPSSILLRVEDF